MIIIHNLLDKYKFGAIDNLSVMTKIQNIEDSDILPRFSNES